MRFLVVNADDFNLTENVSRAIFKAHDRGIVTSTSVFCNLPLSKFQLTGLQKRKTLGIGLHLNLTFGEPLSKPNLVSSLVDREGFLKRLDQFKKSRIELKLQMEELLRFDGLWNQLSCFPPPYRFENVVLAVAAFPDTSWALAVTVCWPELHEICTGAVYGLVVSVKNGAAAAST